ncbi:MAG: hypothetical protein JSV15_05760 [Candidatus Bathyarchaeota archaeon]|nr:MAG: hypothetical protein JSV15_05760 [Candidatus Bathyarchaeota archaeon]
MSGLRENIIIGIDLGTETNPTRFTMWKTELIGDNKEGYIIVSIKSDWRKLQI